MPIYMMPPGPAGSEGICNGACNGAHASDATKFMGRKPTRRDFLLTASVIATESPSFGLGKPDFTLRIAPISVDLAPGKTIRTVAYNGSVPGPVLRMKEGKPVTVDIFNDTDVPELVHWHGQTIPAKADGAEEEGSPFVPAHGHLRVAFTPKPAGTR